MHLLTDDGQVAPEKILELVKTFDHGLRNARADGNLQKAVIGQFYVKFILQLNTLILLKNGIPFAFEGKEIVSYDDSSAFVIARTMLETYLNFVHIYVTPKNDSESEFRFDCWHLNGLLSRQKILKYRPHLEETQPESVAADRQEIERLKPKIAGSQHMNGFSPGQQSDILKGKNWRQKNISEIATEAAIDPSFAQMFYSYTSGHTHTDSINILQNYQKQNLLKREGIDHALQYCGLIAVKFLWNLIEKFPQAKELYSQEQVTEIEVCAKQMITMG